MKLFKVNEFDTVAATSLDEAVTFYKDWANIEADEFEPAEIPSEEWDEMKIKVKGKDLTFTNFMKSLLKAKHEFPCVFCTTDP